MSEDKFNYSSDHQINDDLLPVPENELHGWKHFAGLYGGEHISATEFVIGATFVAIGASAKDIFLGLFIGNVLAILSWRFLAAPVAVETRLSLYGYLNKVGRGTITKLYNWANVIIFVVISAAMITVSASAVRFIFNVPEQLGLYPTNFYFVLIVIGVGMIVVFITMYGFTRVADFSSICAPWLFIMFVCGAFILLPVLSSKVLGTPHLSSLNDLFMVAKQTVWKGSTADGGNGIGLAGIIGFAWAANTITHVGLIDMAIFRFARKKVYGYNSGFGMICGHYIAWIAAGIMGAGAAVILGKSITELDPGDVAYYALGISGYLAVIIAGWTTANTNMYRAGLAATEIFKGNSRKRVTLIVGLITVVVACFPFVFTQILPLLTYAGLLVVPVGAIVFTEHFIFPKIGFTRYWALYKGLTFSTPAVVAWVLGLLFGFGLDWLSVMPFFYLFIPTWFFTSIVYTLLAKKYGASEKYPKAKKEEEQRSDTIKRYQHQKAASAVEAAPDKSLPTILFDGISWLTLVALLALAVNAMLFSSTMEVYDHNKLLFFRYGAVCTVVYFVFGYWAKRRKTKSGKQAIQVKEAQAVN